MKCFECETTEDIQQHHVVPKVRGGTKTIPLCYSCHSKAHGLKDNGLNHSRLTKEGLAVAKAKGVKLGNPNLDQARKAANASNREKGIRTVEQVMPMIEMIQSTGITSYNGIARKLNGVGYKTPRGSEWNATSVRRIMLRNRGVDE